MFTWKSIDLSKVLSQLITYDGIIEIVQYCVLEVAILKHKDFYLLTL